MQIKYSPALALARLFHDRQAYFDSTYTHMSIKTMVKGLKDARGVTVCVRTAKNYLRKFEAAGLIKTFPSLYGRKADGTLYTVPPNRSITIKMAKWLRNQGIMVCKWLWDHLTGKVKHRRVKSLDDKQARIQRARVEPRSTATLSKIADSLLKDFK